MFAWNQVLKFTRVSDHWIVHSASADSTTSKIKAEHKHKASIHVRGIQRDKQ